MLARGRAFLMLPIGEGRLYCYADLSSPDTRDPTDGAIHRLVELFGDFQEPVAAILRRLSSACAPHFSPIEEVTSRPWVKDRVVLIGDAAHATSPQHGPGGRPWPWRMRWSSPRSWRADDRWPRPWRPSRRDVLGE
jgi:FAD-dependent urate hydroxylase